MTDREYNQKAREQVYFAHLAMSADRKATHLDLAMRYMRLAELVARRDASHACARLAERL